MIGYVTVGAVERACSLQSEKTEKTYENCLNKVNSFIKYVKNRIEIKNKDRPMLC